MPSNDRFIQAYSTESLSPALAMASTTSVFDQSQIGCHFFFESVMGPYSGRYRAPWMLSFTEVMHTIQLRCLPRRRGSLTFPLATYGCSARAASVGPCGGGVVEGTLGGPKALWGGGQALKR